MKDSGFVRVRRCDSGRVHVQIGFMTLCLETDQLAELVGKGRQALEASHDFETRSMGWSTRLPQ